MGINPDTLDNAWLYPGLPLGDAVAQAREVAPFVNHWHVKQFRRTWSATLGADGDGTLGGAHVGRGGEQRRTVASGYRLFMVPLCGSGARLWGLLGGRASG